VTFVNLLVLINLFVVKPDNPVFTQTIELPPLPPKQVQRKNPPLINDVLRNASNYYTSDLNVAQDNGRSRSHSVGMYERFRKTIPY